MSIPTTCLFVIFSRLANHIANRSCVKRLVYLGRLGLLITVLMSYMPLSTADTTWDMPTAYSINNFHTKNIIRFTEKVRQATKETLIINVHTGASLYKAPHILRAVRSGQVQIGEILMTLLSNQNAVYSIDDLPFFATSYPQALQLSRLQRPYIEKILEQQGMIYLFSVPWPPQGLYTNKPIQSLDDLAGFNFRAYSKQTARLGELLHARPVTVQAAEVSQALAMGKINSLFASSQSGIDYKVWESLQYYYDARSWLPKNMIVVNADSFAALDEDTQKILLTIAKESELEGWQRSQLVTEEANKILLENGIEIRPLSPQLESEFRTLAGIMQREWMNNANPEAVAIAESYMP